MNRSGSPRAHEAIAEIVAILTHDPATAWTRVDIKALRQHLIEMDTVTLHSAVSVDPIPEGATFRVSSHESFAIQSIQRMVIAHAAAMDGNAGWGMVAIPTTAGADLTATGDVAQIRALGFIGIMTLGMHHQAHHLPSPRATIPMTDAQRRRPVRPPDNG